jgi:hypothetical protein
MVFMPEQPREPPETNNSGAGFPASEDAEEPSYFAYSAGLRIFGTIPNLDEISQNLGLTPTHVHRSGESRQPSAGPYLHDMWIYEAPVEESQPLHVHIDALWVAIRDRKQYLLDLKQITTVDVFCGYRSNSDTAGVEVPYKSLQIFQELEVSFGLSIIIT